MRNYLRKDLVDLVPYKANNQSYVFKMDANENPWDLPQEIRGQLAKELMDGNKLNLYPDSDADSLRKTIGTYWGINWEDILIGNGSDELIQIIVNAFVEKGDSVLCPTPSFGMYKIYTRVAGGIPIDVKLTEKFNYDMDLFFDAIKRYNPKVIFLCSPNNPSGNIIPQEDIIKLLKVFEGIVVIDEAYSEFSGESMIKDISSYPNGVVLRTFSKAMGLAGLRIGYSVCNKELASQIYKIKPPYNINSFSQRTAQLILENGHLVGERIELIVNQREKLYKDLKDINGIDVYPSKANFILVRVPKGNLVFNELLKRGILVRNFAENSILKDCLRITVGHEEANARLIKALKEIIQE